jgi:hypothetical protein
MRDGGRVVVENHFLSSPCLSDRYKNVFCSRFPSWDVMSELKSCFQQIVKKIMPAILEHGVSKALDIRQCYAAELVTRRLTPNQGRMFERAWEPGNRVSSVSQSFDASLKLY